MLFRDCSEGVMVKSLAHPYEAPQNHGWMKIKNQYEIDCLVVRRNETKTPGVYNYVIAAGPISKEHATALRPGDVFEWQGLLFMILGKTDSTRLKLSRGAILRVAAEEVLESETSNPKFKRYSTYIARVLEAVPEKSVPDGLDVLARLAALSSAPRESASEASEKSLPEKESDTRTPDTETAGMALPKVVTDAGFKKLAPGEYEQIRREGEPLPSEYYADQRRGDFWSQFHWRGVPEKGGALLQHSVHCDLRMDLGLGFLVQWVLTGRLRKLKRAILGEDNPATGRLEQAEAIVKPSAEPPEELLRSLAEDPDEPTSEAECHDWEIKSGSYWIAPGQVGATSETWAYMMLIDRGEVVEGIQRRDAHEYFFRGKRFKGRYILRKLEGSRDGGEYWIFFRPKDQFPANPTEHEDEGYHFPMKPRGDAAVVVMSPGMRYHRANAVIEETGDVLKVTAVATKAGVFKGVYRPAEVLEKYHHWLLGVPVTLGHPQDGVYFDQEAVGKVIETRWEPPEVVVVAELWKDRLPPALLEKIRSGEPVDVSVGFYPTEKEESGELNGEKYDHVETSLFFDHLAIVPQGACSWEDGCGIRKHAEIEDLESFDLRELTDDQLRDYFRKAFAWWCSLARGVEMKFSRDQIKQFLKRVLAENDRRGRVFEPHPEGMEDCAQELWRAVQIETHRLVPELPYHPGTVHQSETSPILADDILAALRGATTIKEGIVQLVGSVAELGQSENDADFLIKFHSIRPSSWDGLCRLVAESTASDAEKAMLIERIRQLQSEIYDEIVFPIELKLRRAFPPEMQRRIHVFLDEYNGPITNSIPVWDLRCEPVLGGEVMPTEIEMPPTAPEQPAEEKVEVADDQVKIAVHEIKSLEDLMKAVEDAKALEDAGKRADALAGILEEIIEQAKAKTGLFAGPTMYPYPKYPYPDAEDSALEWDAASDPEEAKAKIAEGIRELIKAMKGHAAQIRAEYEEREKRDLVDRITKITGHAAEAYMKMDATSLRAVASDLEKVAAKTNSRTDFKIDSSQRDVSNILAEFNRRRKRGI